MSAKDRFLSASSTIVNLVKEVSDLYQMWILYRKDNCIFLVEHILRFLKDIYQSASDWMRTFALALGTAALLNNLLS